LFAQPSRRSTVRGDRGKKGRQKEDRAVDSKRRVGALHQAGETKPAIEGSRKLLEGSHKKGSLYKQRNCETKTQDGRKGPLPKERGVAKNYPRSNNVKQGRQNERQKETGVGGHYYPIGGGDTR